MLKNEYLYYLIKSLSKSEKRHFRLYNKGDSNNYLLLFDAIEKQSHYDGIKIKETFKKKDFIKQLHVTKNYLNNQILKSLKSYHSKISKSAELKELIRDIEILLKKDILENLSAALNYRLKSKLKALRLSLKTGF